MTAFPSDKFERIGGAEAHDVYELTVSRPASRTFYLSRTDLEINGQQYHGIVSDCSGAIVESSIGGFGSGRLALTIIDDLRSGLGLGKRRRFTDWFAEPVAGYDEPYDLDSATVTAKIVARADDGTFVAKTVGVYDLEPTQTERGNDDLLTLSFVETRKIHRVLPRRKIRQDVWPRLPGDSAALPIPLAYGAGLRLPGIIVDDVEGKYVFCESPSDTPVRIRRIEGIVQDRETGRDKLVSLYSPVVARVINTLVTGRAVELTHAPGVANGGNVNFVEFGINATGTSRLIVAAIGVDDETVPISSATSGGVPMTKLDGVTLAGTGGAANISFEVWYITNPTQGWQIVRANLASGVTRNMTMVPLSFANVDQATPFGTVAKQTATSASPSLNVSAVAEGMVIDAVFTSDQDVTAVGSGQTELNEGACFNKDKTSPNNIHRLNISRKDGAAGTVTVSNTIAASDELGQIAFCIRSNASATTTWLTLTERGQTFRLDKGGLGDQVTIRLRPKSGDPAPVGKITLRLEWTAGNGVPSDDMTERVAGTEIDAGIVTADGEYVFKWSKEVSENAAPPIITTDQIAFTVRYAKDATGGNIEIGINGDGGYDNGAACERGSTRDEWVQSENARALKADTGLAGDGFITGDPYFGKNVYDYFERGGHKVLQIGQVSDSPGDLDTSVGFMRFPLANITPADYQKIVLRLYLQEKEGMSLVSSFAMYIDEIADFGTLDVLDWNGTQPSSTGFFSGPQYSVVRTSFGIAATHDTEDGSFIDIDVTTAVAIAKSAGLSHIAFRLRGVATGHTGAGNIGFDIVAADDGGPNVPQLRLIKDGGQDLQFALDMLQFTVEDSIDDGTGNGVALVDFSRPLGERLVAAFLDGMKDDGSGTYTGTSAALIENGADVVRHVALHPIALGAVSGLVDLDALTTAREMLRTWTSLAGIIYEAAESQTWIARIAASAKAIAFPSAEGKLTMIVHGTRSQPVRTIAPWEHSNLKQIALGRSELGLPWSRVDVYYDRDLLSLENLSGARSKTAEWDGYVFVSSEDAFPVDAGRVAEAAERLAAYGERSNGGTSPSDTNSFHFVGGDGLTGQRGRAVRDFLWDDVGAKIDALDGITVELPRFAVNFAVGDEIDVLAYEFPARFERAMPGEVLWGDATWDQGGVRWGAARRGRFTVRSLGVAVNSPKLPVIATLKLEEWRS